VAKTQPGSSSNLYEERLTTPWWVVALAFAIGPAVAIPAMVIGAATGAPSPWTAGVVLLFVLGGIFAAIFWAIGLRTVIVRPEGLRLGRRRVAFADIESVRSVDRAEAKRLQSTMRYSPIRPSTWSQRNRAYGAWWQRWMNDPILVRLKPGVSAVTSDWLIGTRHRQELLDLIESGMQHGTLTTVPPDAAPSLA
jgi:hypothetical protein